MEQRYKEEYYKVEPTDCITRDVRISERTISPRSHMENEKRLRREIANSNERRRMQSINAGFQSLRTLLPGNEGEKLSKAAILQQTAEYIYSLEQEKTGLLAQNCQLKRLLQQEGDNPPLKKRKLDSSIEEYTPSPESLTEADSVVELRLQLDRERRLRLRLEEKLSDLEATMYPEGLHLTYESHEGMSVIEHNTPPTSEVEEGSETVENAFTIISDSDIIPSSALPVLHTQTVSTTPSIKVEPEEEEEEGNPEAEAAARLLRRLPRGAEDPVAEPKVEVERLPTPGVVAASLDDTPSMTSRQSLETIVEAIRHLEGDHLFSDIASTPSPAPAPALPPQDAPLALTTKHQASQRLIKVDMNPFLKFHTTQSLQHQRPGVIVVKHT